MSKINEDAVKAMIEDLPNWDSLRCPNETNFGCSRYEDYHCCEIVEGDTDAVVRCWVMAFNSKKKKKKMGKVTKALMKYATDGGAKTNYLCPVDAGFNCPSLSGGAYECTASTDVKQLRKCWKKLYKSESENTNE